MKRAIFPLLIWFVAISIAFIATAQAQVPLPPHRPDNISLPKDFMDFTRPPVTMHVFLPPKRFDHEYRSALLTIKRFKTSEELHQFCIVQWTPGFDVACSFIVLDACFIGMLDDDALISRGFNIDHVMRHEIGHCNGWGGDHAGAIDPRSR